jgi:type II secretory pathway component PulJ
MRTILHERQGTTLIEQVVALLLGAVVILALYGFYRAQLFQTLAQETKTATLQDGRGALDIMVRDLKNAGSWGNGGILPLETGNADDPDADPDGVCNRVYAATAAIIHVQMDLNGNGNCADTDPRENIRYELTGPTSTCSGMKVIRRNGDCLVANVSTPATGKLFSYFNDAGTDLGDAPSLAAIKRVRIAFTVELKNPDPKIGGSLASALSTSVELRN